MDVHNSVLIAGDLPSIFDLAARVERWPQILPHYRRVDVIEPGERDRVVEMYCVRDFGILRWPCRWRARQVIRPEDAAIEYFHLSGPARGMSVLWRLSETAGGVQTTITHHVPDSRGWGRDFYFSRIVGPIFVANIAARTVATIKGIVERESFQ